MSRDDPPIPADLLDEGDAPEWAPDLDEELERSGAVVRLDGMPLDEWRSSQGLDEAIAVAPAIAHEWELETRTQVEWAMRRLAVLQERATEVRQLASGWAARIDEWQDAELRRIHPGIDRFTGLLERYGKRARAENPKEATIRVPSGDIKTTKPKQPTVSVVDEAAVLAWLLDQVSVDVYEEVVKAEPHVKLTEFRGVVDVAYELLPVCQVCGESLEVVADAASASAGETGVWHKNRAPGDHDPMPSGGYVVRLDGAVVPGVKAELGEITAKPVVRR